jgi:hypothetical protein
MGTWTQPLLDQWDQPIDGHGDTFLFQSNQTVNLIGNKVSGTQESGVPDNTPNRSWPNLANSATIGLGDSKINVPDVADTLAYLRQSNFGFSLPASSTIEGIEVSIIWAATAVNYPNVNKDEIKVAWGVAAANLSTTDKGDGTAPTAAAEEIYGGVADLWGELASTLTQTVIESTDFGCVLLTSTDSNNNSHGIDAMQMKVSYSKTEDGAVRTSQVYAEVIDVINVVAEATALARVIVVT